MFCNIAFNFMAGITPPDNLIQETSQTMKIMQIAMIIITVLVVIGFIYAFIYTCKKNKIDDEKNSDNTDEEERK